MCIYLCIQPGFPGPVCILRSHLLTRPRYRTQWPWGICTLSKHTPPPPPAPWWAGGSLPARGAGGRARRDEWMGTPQQCPGGHCGPLPAASATSPPPPLAPQHLSGSEQRLPQSPRIKVSVRHHCGERGRNAGFGSSKPRWRLGGRTSSRPAQ